MPAGGWKGWTGNWLILLFISKSSGFKLHERSPANATCRNCSKYCCSYEIQWQWRLWNAGIGKDKNTTKTKNTTTVKIELSHWACKHRCDSFGFKGFCRCTVSKNFPCSLQSIHFEGTFVQRMPFKQLKTFSIYLELAGHDVGSSFVCQVRVRPLQWRLRVIKTFCCRVSSQPAPKVSSYGFRGGRLPHKPQKHRQKIALLKKLTSPTANRRGDKKTENVFQSWENIELHTMNILQSTVQSFSDAAMQKWILWKSAGEYFTKEMYFQSL